MATVELPQRFEDADPDHLVLLIADMLQRLIVHNDQVPLSPEGLTRFHSRSPPAITVLEYLRRIVKYTKAEKSCVLITLHYIDQICARFPLFTISSLTVHRFIIAAVAVSSKALCDVFCTNSHYAKVGGTRVEELNLLEREFLSFIDWRLTCTRELLQAYYTNLVRTHSTGAFTITAPPPSSVISSGSDDAESCGSRSASPAARARSASVDSSDEDAHSPVIGPSTVLRVVGRPPEGAPAQPTGPTMEQAAAFAALRKPETPCAVDVVRREKRSSGQVVDHVEDLRPRGRRRMDN